MKIRLAALAFCSALMSGSAAAQVILLDQQPIPAANTTPATFSNVSCDLGQGNLIGSSAAEDFTVVQTVEITSLTFWGSYTRTLPVTANGPLPAITLFSVQFLANDTNADLPGAFVTGRAPITVPTFLFTDVGGSDVFQFDVTFLPVTLPPGDYWVEVFAEATEPLQTCFNWRAGFSDPMRSRAFGATDINVAPGVNWQTNVDLSVSLQAALAPPPPVAPVEIPTLETWMLIALAGGLALSGWLLANKQLRL